MQIKLGIALDHHRRADPHLQRYHVGGEQGCCGMAQPNAPISCPPAVARLQTFADYANLD
ncbi:MAG: hypothetical protein JOY99_08480 [Sphingomonadaceae bacterium]|nr:hypothetical protein [Sphingomonadaceae bacterium]